MNNPYGLQLTGSTTKVRHELQLANGHLFLQNNILIIGDGKPGAIGGYDVNGAAAVNAVVVWDVQGRKIQEVTVNARTIIEMRLFIPGTYMVGFISHSGKILETKKLVIKPF